MDSSLLSGLEFVSVGRGSGHETAQSKRFVPPFDTSAGRLPRATRGARKGRQRCAWEQLSARMMCWALVEHVQPAQMDRLGLRYIDSREIASPRLTKKQRKQAVLTPRKKRSVQTCPNVGSGCRAIVASPRTVLFLVILACMPKMGRRCLFSRKICLCFHELWTLCIGTVTEQHEPLVIASRLLPIP
jgi:hypothetical protein